MVHEYRIKMLILLSNMKKELIFSNYQENRTEINFGHRRAYLNIKISKEKIQEMNLVTFCYSDTKITNNDRKKLQDNIAK